MNLTFIVNAATSKQLSNEFASPNLYVRRSMCIDGAAGTRGAIKGSFPVNGYFGACEYLNWVCKFTKRRISCSKMSRKTRLFTR